MRKFSNCLLRQRLRACAAVLSSIGLLALGACGGDSGSEESDRATATAGLLGLRDLPLGAERPQRPFRQDDCSPPRNLRPTAESLANAPTYLFESVTFLHTVAVFPTERAAEEAFRRVTGPSNDRCTVAEMAQKALEQTGRPADVAKSPFPVEVPPGYQADGARYAAIVPRDSRKAYFDTVAIRRGRIVLCLGFATNNAPPSASSRTAVTRKARARLARVPI